MKVPRRQFLHLAASAAVLPVASRYASAQTYPTRPITLNVPFAAGGPTDAVARIIAERMRTTLGQAVIIENVAGADGTIGVGRVARAVPDGYTLSIGQWGTHVLNGAAYPLQYDVLTDFDPISLLTSNPYIVVTKKSLLAKDLKEPVRLTASTSRPQFPHEPTLQLGVRTSLQGQKPKSATLIRSAGRRRRASSAELQGQYQWTAEPVERSITRA